MFYFSWVTIYFLINFVISKDRIQKRNYDNMYAYYMRIAWSRKLLTNADKYNKYGGALLFIFFHFIFFCAGHICANICFYSYYYHTFCILLWLTWSIWNASCFYMNYFAQKYQSSLLLLEQA